MVDLRSVDIGSLEDSHGGRPNQSGLREEYQMRGEGGGFLASDNKKAVLAVMLCALNR
jgi:hypothetical protein